MKGRLVRNKAKPEWGAGVVVEQQGANAWVLFEEDGSKRLFKVEQMAKYLQLDVADVPQDSPLRMEARWPELETLPPNFNETDEARDARRCEVCDRLLRDAQDTPDKLWKSCPKCSRENGHVHVFYRRPDAFGTTVKRVNPNNPDGVHSYCYFCRDRGELAKERRLCGE